MKYEEYRVDSELVVIGAGIAGMCCALQAARMGVHTVLINNRGVVGGNSSAEIFVSINGANDGNPLNINLREGGIVDELRLEYLFRSPGRNRYALDGVFMDAIYKEKLLDLYLNTCIDEVNKEGTSIISVVGTQNTSETRYIFTGKWFVDASGDGVIGALAEAKYMLGRESKANFNEKLALEKADSFCLPSTLSFTTKDMGKPIKYIAPDYADDISDSGALCYRVIPHKTFYRMQWYYEVSGELDQVKDRELIMLKHRNLIAGIWNYIKNSGEYPEAENYDLEYISCIPGMREYRRLVGDFILTEKQLVEQEEYVDVVGHGGWNIDLHAIKGFYDSEPINRHIFFRGPYQIPFRCGYSKNVSNLFMCGRCMSTSHVALGSVRVSGTLATLGQAVGMASYFCKIHSANPRDIYEKHIKKLQQALLREDQLILGEKNEDVNDKALEAEISGSSALKLEALSGSNYRYVEMGEGIGIVLPVKTKVNSISIQIRTPENGSIDYRLYEPLKPYNYGPDKLIEQHSCKVQKGLSVVILYFNKCIGEKYYFIELNSSENVEVMAIDNKLPTTMMFKKRLNHSVTNWDYYNLGESNTTWGRTTQFPCFSIEPAQEVYSSTNINNRYNRAYMQPNLWYANPGDAIPEIKIDWKHYVNISMIQMTFYIDTTSILADYTKGIFPGIVSDYKIYACTVNGEKLIVENTNNHSKRQRHFINPIQCNQLKIVCEKGLCERRIGIQEIRVE